MHIMGLEGMPRRVVTYPNIEHLALLNGLATAGAFVIALAVVLFGFIVLLAFRKRVPVPNDPWGGYTLEWATSSPPPEFNFHSLPNISSERPVFDARQAAARAAEGLA